MMINSGRRRTQLMRQAIAVLGVLSVMAGPLWAQSPSAKTPGPTTPFEVQIDGVGSERMQLSLGELAGDAQGLTSVIRADLQRSGLFNVVSAGAGLTEHSPLNIQWGAQGIDAVVAGSVQQEGSQVSIRWRLWDTVKNQDLGGGRETTSGINARMAAHKVADAILARLTGKSGPGNFASRVAYVHQQGGKYQLMVADSDGENARVALTSSQPIISPSWSPNGIELAYVSFETMKPVVWVQNIQTGQRRMVANFKGSNSAPAWSPDGSRLAVTLTVAGGSQLFILPKNGGEPQRLTSSNSIDTEPTFTADGAIYFVSDRGGSPQIYRIRPGEAQPQRVTFNGSYNISPTVSADGRYLAYITRQGGFRLMLQDLRTGQVRALSSTTADERPTFAPGGQLVLYATRQGGRMVLMSATLDGRVQTPLSSQSLNVSQPSWGAFQ